MADGGDQTAQERFDNVGPEFQPISVEAIVKYWLKDQWVTVNHPITVMNPDGYFSVAEVKIEDGRIYIRGENTMWFSEELVKVYIGM